MKDQWLKFLALTWLVKQGTRVVLVQGDPATLPASVKLLIC